MIHGRRPLDEVHHLSRHGWRTCRVYLAASGSAKVVAAKRRLGIARAIGSAPTRAAATLGNPQLIAMINLLRLLLRLLHNNKQLISLIAMVMVAGRCARESAGCEMAGCRRGGGRPAGGSDAAGVPRPGPAGRGGARGGPPSGSRAVTAP